jgi:primary-amine oxidase
MAGVPHPFDPLSGDEIRTAIDVVKKEYGELNYHAVSLLEPRKKDIVRWQQLNAPKPARIAEITAIGYGGAVYDGFVDMDSARITKWEKLEGVQPIVSSHTLL